MRLLVPVFALLLGTAGVRLDAATVEIRVTSGDLITGEVVSETANTLELKRLVLVRHKPVETSITVQKSTITTRKEVPALTQQYEARRDNADASLLAQCALARWCLDRALTEQALVHTRRAEESDNASAIVAKLYRDLGFVQVEGKWVAEDEHLASTGKVKVGDSVLTKEEAAAAKEQQLKAGSNARIEQQIRDAEWVIKTGEKKLAEATERRDKAKDELTKAEADSKGAASRKEQIQKRLDARAGKNQNNRTQQQDREDQAALQQASTEATQAGGAQKKWEKELENANEALAKVKAAIDKAKTTLPELQKQLEAAGGKPATGDKAGEKAGEKTAEKPAEKPADKGADGKPKSRFGGE
jgi:predicted  nucleic acid-binding Zn-ribbon protein